MSADQDDIFRAQPKSSSPTPAPPIRRPSTIERAFELARSGSFRTIEEIGRQLKQEQQESVDAHLAGTSIRKNLRQICAETRTLKSARTGEADGAAE